MNDFNDERRYAWRMIRAARLAQAAGMQTNGSVLFLQCSSDHRDLPSL